MVLHPLEDPLVSRVLGRTPVHWRTHKSHMGVLELDPSPLEDPLVTHGVLGLNSSPLEAPHKSHEWRLASSRGSWRMRSHVVVGGVSPQPGMGRLRPIPCANAPPRVSAPPSHPPTQYGRSDSYRVATTQDKGNEKGSPQKGSKAAKARDLDDLKKEVAMVSGGVGRNPGGAVSRGVGGRGQIEGAGYIWGCGVGVLGVIG